MSDAMDSTDAEMKDGEEHATAAAPPQQVQNNTVKELLSLARQLVNQGQPSQALQAVVTAMRNKGGDEAVIQSLQRAREMYIDKLKHSTAVDQLASLFAECAIAEAQPFVADTSQASPSVPSAATGVQGNSILAETGRMQIVLDAFSDGSSFICLQCGGLVSNHRKDEHYGYWCCKVEYAPIFTS